MNHFKIWQKNIKEVESSLQQSRAEAAEQRDKEGRKNNIILYMKPLHQEQMIETKLIYLLSSAIQ